MKFQHTSLLLFLVCVAAFGQESPLRFEGEVKAAQEFRREIGRGLVFVLHPDDSGWTITVSAADGAADFVWVVMPPYRSYNPRYLNATYGTTAREAVGMSPREFEFVLNEADYKSESEWVNRLLWSYSYTKGQVKEAEQKRGTSPQGKGTLKILDSKISPSGELIEGKDLGKIDWIKFAVKIRFPAAPERK